MQTLIDRSIAIIEEGQTPNGAYVACPRYATYNYCWFRDGTFIAYAMDLWQRHESAERFYNWSAQAILARAEAVERCIKTAEAGLPLVQADLLNTRYTAEGTTDAEEWPDFQLDGFGTLLWGFERHVQLVKHGQTPELWSKALRLVIRYLAALWQHPNFDCWEEFADRIAVSTLAALYAGLHASATLLDADSAEAKLACATAAQIKARVLRDGVLDGHLIKQLHGDTAVDASLLWACVPFGEHGLLSPTEPLMQATAARIEQELVGGTGGVHRYLADTFYGGGEWILLTALLGEYWAVVGDLEGAQRSIAFVEAQADADGYLPEQSSVAALQPSRVAEWVERWGPVARPLLWSHANYLSLAAKVGALNHALP